MLRTTRALTVAALLVLLPLAAAAQAPVAYRLTFPEPEHRWMQVEVTFAEVPPGTLQIRMSRSSPGRYAAHDFAKNVYDVAITDAAGRALSVTRPNPHQWDVGGHAGTVRVRYKVFGDRVDGTYLGIDSTHAHINMPAALMWARGLDARPATVRFERPAGTTWRVATQLMPGADEFTFTAPDLQYLMDSPTEFSAHTVRTFRVPDVPNGPLFRVAVHHQGTDAEVESLVADVQRMVAEARRVYGEFPAFDGNTYTFIADYLPWASGDAMEHRNSTFVTSSSSIRASRLDLLGSMSHEFFHVWNVERVRPRALEPFNFEDANMTSELWLAEGVTSYYEPLVLRRAGLMDLDDYVSNAATVINTITLRPGRLVRTVEEMSQHAPFVDAATSIDRTNFGNTFISYYTWGEGIGLGLDLTLRERSGGRTTLDQFMLALWRRHRDRPYTADDVKATLAEVSGDGAFADDFFARYIQGHEVVDYARLLAQAGLLLRPRFPGQGFAGELQLQDAPGGVRVAAFVPTGSPAYTAGLDRDDTIVSIGGAAASTAAVEQAIRGRKPGETIPIVFERRGQRVEAKLTIAVDPRQEIVLAERVGQPLTPAQRSFRAAWLSSTGGNTF